MLDLLRDPAAFRSACRTTKPSVIPFAPGSRTAPANRRRELPEQQSAACLGESQGGIRGPSGDLQLFD